MLILVAVTINLAADGGLFAKSRKAARDTEEQTIYDQIVSAMELNENGKIKPIDTFESFKSKYGGNEIKEKGGNTETKIVFTIKGARDTYTYTITENEIIIGEVKELSDYDVLKRYFLGADGNGRKIYDEIFNEERNGLIDDENTEIDESKYTISISYGPENADDSYIIKCNNAIYKIDYIEKQDENNDWYTLLTDFRLIYQQNLNSREGKDLGVITGKPEYNGWTILYDNGSDVEAVSPIAMGELHLGSDNDASGNTEEANSEYDKAITSYDNAIETINNYCKSLSGLPSNISVRSIGAEVDNTNTYGNLDPLNNEWANNRGFEIVNRGKKQDRYYEQDICRMIYYNVINGEKKYVIASRVNYLYSNSLRLGIYCTNMDSELYSEKLFCLDDNSTTPRAYSTTLSVRPIIKVNI